MRTPSGRAVRPTPARVKEALFSILAGRIANARILDLYAGTGALGFEALSRGAHDVTFVEMHRPTALALREAAAGLALDAQIRVIIAPAERAVTALEGRFDLVFADPPYIMPYPIGVFATLRARAAIDTQSLVVYEHSARSQPPADAAFTLERTARYGEVALSFLRMAA